jgi:hypothetical protein
MISGPRSPSSTCSGPGAGVLHDLPPRCGPGQVRRDHPVLGDEGGDATNAIPDLPNRGEGPCRETTKGKRLWTRAQIDGILKIAASERVILNGKPPTKRFAERVLDLYRELLQKDEPT